MVAHLIRLRFQLLANAFRKSTWQLIATIIAALYGLGILGLAVAALFGLSFGTIEIARTATVLAGAVVVLGWIVVPLLASGVDQTVDPARLATFPIPLNQLLVGLTFSGVFGVAGMVTTLASLATALTWWRYPIAALAAIVCGAVGVLTCVIGSRMIAALATGIGSGRRARETKRLLVFIPLVLLGPIIVGLIALLRRTSTSLPDIAAVVSWTPFGAIWAVPADIAVGDYMAASLRFLIGLATVVVFAAIWRVGLAHALETPTRASATRVGAKSLGLFANARTPTAAVTARALTYWIRDPRYAQSLIVVPLLPMLLAFYGGLNGNWTLLNITGPGVALLLGLSIFTDVSYDNTAYALHLQTGVSGRADRLGRVIALASFSLPLVVALTVASVAITQTWHLLPALLGLGLGALLSGFGLSSVISGRFAFEVPAPGDNPFKAKPGGGITLTLSMLGTWGGLTILCLPELVLAIIGIVTGIALYGWLALAVGIVLGCTFLTVGVRVGGRVLDRHGPELLAQLVRQK